MERRQPTVAVLSYHKIGAPPAPPRGWESWFYVPQDAFVRHIEILRAQLWQIVSLPDLLRGLMDPSTLPDRSALLTFDDGYRSMRTIVLPILRQLSCAAVVFMPTEFIGRTNTFDQDDEPEEEMCTWDDLRALEAGGVAIESHGISHRAFSELSDTELDCELRASKKQLERGLHRKVQAFAFPYGDDGKGRAKRRLIAQLLQAAGYRAAFLYGGKPRRFPASNCYRLPRIAVGPDTDLGRELRCLTGERP